MKNNHNTTLASLLSIVFFMGASSVHAQAAKEATIQSGSISRPTVSTGKAQTQNKTKLSDKEINAVLIKAAGNFNKNLPMSVDKDTRWDTTIAGYNRKLVYYYTLVNMASDEIDLPNFKTIMKDHLKNGVCSNQDLKVLFESGVTLGYSYNGSDGKHLGKVEFSPKECGYQS